MIMKKVFCSLTKIPFHIEICLDLQLAAELGRCLLERNQELQNYVGVLQKQIDDEQCDIKVKHQLFFKYNGLTSICIYNAF